jgi:hypothetical protein
MTPERASKVVTRWVHVYTRGLPTPIAQRRVDEVGADLHDHITHERARGTSDRRIALSILSRMARGVNADASWRHRVRPLKGDPMKSNVATFAIALGIAALGVALMVYAEADDAPGGVLFGMLMIVGAVALGVRTALRKR